MSNKRFNAAGKITGCKLPQWVNIMLHEFCTDNDGQPFSLRITAGKPRSTKQNRYYWGVVIPVVMQMLHAAECAVSPEVAHEYLKQRFARAFCTVSDADYVARSVPLSTTEYTTDQHIEYVTAITAWAAEYGYTIPSPNEVGFDSYY